MDTKMYLLLPSHLASIKENGLVFSDNTSLEADVIVLATGYMNMKVSGCVASLEDSVS